jgi:RNA polymerase sigma-32 factor
MKAVKRFDPDQGVRLVSYAMHWIKAEIHEYILKNWRMVKVATTKAQRKLFFNLRSMKQGFKADEPPTPTRTATRCPSTKSTGGAQLNVKREEVIEMETRMSGGDVLLDPSPSDDGEQAFGPIAYLADAAHEPTAMIEVAPARCAGQRRHCHALASLDARSRRIVEERWLKVNDDGSGGMTLHDLAAVYGVSAERIRQIEVAAMKKMKKAAHAGRAAGQSPGAAGDCGKQGGRGRQHRRRRRGQGHRRPHPGRHDQRQPDDCQAHQPQNQLRPAQGPGRPSA